MTWPPSPPAGQGPASADPQSAYYPGMPAPPQYPGQRPARPAVMRWVAGAVVFSLLLVSAVVVHRTVLSRFLGGASSPEEAVTQAIAAIEAGDVQRLGLLLPPDEVAGLSDVVREANRILAAVGDEGDLSSLTSTRGLQVNVENLELQKQHEQNGLTKVSIENADITASFDPEQLSEQMKEYLDDEGLSDREFAVTVRGADVTADDDTETLTLGGREQAPFVMTVEHEGSWYVSPLFTLMQYATEDEGYPTSPASSSPGFASPVEAAEGFVSGLAEAINTRDVTAFAEAVGGVESRLLQTYRSLINSGLAEADDDELSVDVVDSQFRQLSVDGNTARVRVERLAVTGTADGETGEIDWDGQCLTIDDQSDRERYCLGDESTIGPFSPLIERLNYVVAVRADGGWKLSTTRTLFSMAADVLSWVGDAELPIIKALMRVDPTELTNVAEVSGTVDIDDTITVHVEPIGRYLDAGYVVVDIPNPRGDEFEVHCQNYAPDCDVVTLVTPSGEAESSYRGGRDGETGVYKAIVIAPAGKVEILVVSD